MPKGGIGTAGSDIADYSKQIISEIISGKISDLKQLNERKMRLSRELLIPELPKNPDIHLDVLHSIVCRIYHWRTELPIWQRGTGQKFLFSKV